MNKKQYQLLEHGKVVPMTVVDSIGEMIECVRAFENEWRRIQTIKGCFTDVSPYTIGLVEGK